MNITRRDALMGATAAAVVTTAITVPLAIKANNVKAALGGEEAQALALFRQLNSHRQGISLMAMRTFLEVQRHNESMGWAEEPPKSAYPWGAPS